MSRNRFIAMLVGVLLMVNLTSIFAQEPGNLLLDPGFEGTGIRVVARDQAANVTCAVNTDWRGWVTETPRTADWMNRIPNCTGRNNAGVGFVRTGNRSQELSRGFSTFTAAVFQTVTVPANANLIGTAYVVMNIDGDKASNANSLASVGVDPTGGNNPLSSNVIWSSSVRNALASNGYQQMTVNATAQGTQVTFFLFATQTVPTKGNGVFFDDASLVVGGPGGGPGLSTTTPANTPVPTAPPFVPFVTAQGAQPDGSIVHSVKSQDTLASIAVAYGVTIDEIRELNPEIGQGRFLMIGQPILIKEASAQPTTVAAVPTQSSGAQPTQETTNSTSSEQPLSDNPPAAQLPIMMSTFYFWTNDMDATREFYTNTIGLSEGEFFQEEEVAILTYDFGNFQVIFQQASSDLPVMTTFSRQPNYDGGEIDMNSFVIRVDADNFDQILDRVKADPDIRIFTDDVVIPQVGQRALYLLDPMGTTVQVITGGQ